MAIRSVASGTGKVRHPGRIATSGGGGGGGGATPTSLLHFDGANGSTTFTDEYGVTWTANASAQLTTTQQKFGTASLLVTGPSACIHTPDQAGFQFGSGDFTVEGQFRLGAFPAGFAYAITKFDSVFTGFVIYVSSTGVVACLSSVDGLSWGVNIASPVSTFTIDTWNHIAFTRSGNSWRAFFNGNQFGSTVTLAGTMTDVGARRLTIGANALSDAATQWGGFVDEVRITKGTAWYTADFTPPTSAFSPP